MDLKFPSWGAILQEKYIATCRLACCPTMDLISILTQDRQLIVYRTISWQRALNVTSSQVPFTIDTMVWSPDGMKLAVGCQDGEVVVYDIATTKYTELQPPHTLSESFQHTTCIKHMHWVETKDNTTSLLVTVDQDGRIGCWWQGQVLVSKIMLHHHLDLNEICVESIHVSNDLSVMTVVVTSPSVKDVRILQLQISSLKRLQNELCVITQVAYTIQQNLQILRTSTRQMVSEWKNAMRVFELKMGLMGTLYEKYGNHHPPQMDMLSIVVGGMTTPALAQFFAQDIQEMSVIRMQKAFNSGCENLQGLITTMKKALEEMIQGLSTLRGHTRWKHNICTSVLGLDVQAMNQLMEDANQLRTDIDKCHHDGQQTHNDFTLLFQWLMERIRFHTNTNNTNSNTPEDRAIKDSTSLLNQRQLCRFFIHAIDAASTFQQSQSSPFRVETTFGNPISKFLSSPLMLSKIEAMDRMWFNTMTKMTQSLSDSILPESTSCISIVGSFDQVRILSQTEKHHSMKQSDENDVDEDSEDFDAVDWKSLLAFASSTNTDVLEENILIALRIVDRVYLVKSCMSKDRNDWLIAGIDSRIKSNCVIDTMDLYEGKDATKLVTVQCDQHHHGVAWLCLSTYENIVYDVIPKTKSTIVDVSSFTLQSLQSATFSARVHRYSPTSAISAHPSRYKIATQASRGIICVVAFGNQLVILDVEDDDNEDEGSIDVIDS